MAAFTLLQAAILGVVEGLTEFLPISSTFHLIFASRFLGLADTQFLKVFEVFIQSGAILAVLVLYGKKLIRDRDLLIKVTVSFVPTAIVGFLLHKIIKNVFFESPALMIGAFIVVGVIFLVYEWWLVKAKKEPQGELKIITYPQAIVIGLAQALAVIPGVSRAGAVMVAMMGLGTNRKEAAQYSFILALPTICAAAALDVLSLRHELANSLNNLLLLAVGFVVSFIVALVVLRWFISYLQKHSLSLFGWYRLAAGLLLILSLGIFSK